MSSFAGWPSIPVLALRCAAFLFGAKRYRKDARGNPRVHPLRGGFHKGPSPVWMPGTLQA
eukprot:969946-Prorocentrum_lima.AAC.1